MGEGTKIQWAHHTFNPWIGCHKVSEECKHCYAEVSPPVRVHRGLGVELWGPKAERHVTSEPNWDQPHKWNRDAERSGQRARVFCASLADVFEDRRDLDDARDGLWELIKATPSLDWLLLTKRPEHIRTMLPPAWLERPQRNVWLGTTCGTQATADERIPHLMRTPAAVRFLSIEPMLEDVRVWQRGDPHPIQTPIGEVLPAGGLSWCIVGGESGPWARRCETEWIRSIVGQCRRAHVSVFVKQMGAFVVDRNDVGFEADAEVYTETGEPTNQRGWPSSVGIEENINGFREEYQGAPVRIRLKDKKGGDPSEWPHELRVREMPEVRT